MQDFIRVAYSGDHEQVERPYRVAMGAKAALWGGITLIALGLLIAAWQLFITSPEPSRAQTGAKTATTRAQSLGMAKSAAVAASAQASARSPAPGPGGGGAGLASSAGPASSGGATSGGDTAGSGQIVVDVDGAVAHPGLYKLPPDSRVQAALAAAGGLSPQADVHRINRAANRP